MSQRSTYSIPTHTLSFPATADRICVAEPRPRTYGEIVRADTHDTRRWMVNPLTGITPAHCTFLGYRYVSSNGETLPFRITPTHTDSPTIVHCSLDIVHWSYTFSAKEKDSETGLSYFGSRYYSSDLSVWLSVDPMASKYPSLSPYVYCADNPGRVVDPNGEEINPIYDRFGYFLGTDDLGLRGDAIIMDNKDFRQNMSHTEAMSKSTCFDPSQSFAAEIRYWDHYKSLKDRPDYDGYLTLDEANEWYRTGDGKPLFADLTKIDLSGFRSLGDSKVGKTYRFNLLLSTGLTDDGLVYGNLTFTRASNNGVRAFADKYDFDMKNWRNPLNWGRNIETIIGQHVAGEGTPYTIYLYGTAQLRSSIFAH